MAEGVRELTESEFDETIATGVTLVDFWAPWCGPCQQQTPIIESLAGSVGDKATIAKVNVDDNAGVAGKLGIQSIPTLILFRDGEEKKRFVGVQPEPALAGAIDEVSG
jgi:thioredoxin 1